MSYVVLARKWRPMRFEDLIGQEHVCRTLGNAIASGRVAHAYLFTGVRGVGKTTAARILAKALNCMGPAGGPTATPCLQCPACKEITGGTDLDVREIDGASYNGVDEVRKLQDSLPYRPARDRFKLFIVDEVHMLSQSAWNAFLKTLEEPPPHVKFIFATTEVHKVPVTILSRVQRFDFKLIPTQLIAERLKHVLSAEGIASDDAAVSVIARQAAGSMRDAMSLLDQVIAWNDQRLEEEAVARVLGVASRQVLHDIARALVGGDPARCLTVIAALADQGYDIATVARDILSLLRDVVVAKVCAEPDPLLDLADDERRDVKSLAAASDADDLLRLHQGFSQAFDDVVRSGQPRAALEMLLVRLARRPPLLPVDDLLGRLGALESRLGGAGQSARRAATANETSTSRGGRPSGPPDEPARNAERAAPSASLPQRHQGRERAAPAARRTPRDPREEPPPAPSSPGVAGAAHSGGLPGAQATAADAAQPLGAWSAIVGRVRSVRPDLAALLAHATPRLVSVEQIVLGIEPGTIFERNTSTAEAMAILSDAAEQELGARPRIRFEEREASDTGDTISAIASRERERERKEAVARAEGHPKLAEATEILGARLKEIRLRGD